MRRPRPTYAAVASTAALVLALGGVGWAASLPKNSVGTAQIRNGSVQSIDIRNGTIARADLKHGLAVAGVGSTTATLSCGTWCQPVSTEGGSTIARIGGAIDFGTSSRQTTPALVATRSSSVSATGTANLYNPNGAEQSVFCEIRNGATVIGATGQIKALPNESATVTVVGTLPSVKGALDLRLACRVNNGGTVAVRSAGLMAVAMER